MNNIIVNSTITSIKVSLISVLITFFISITFIYFNSYKKNKKKSIMDILILLPMFIPPSAIGYIILITLGKNSFIGVILEKYFNRKPCKVMEMNGEPDYGVGDFRIG